MAAQVAGLPHIRSTRPLIENTPETNPYLKRINEGASLFLSSKDGSWKKNTPNLNVLADFQLARRTAAEMDALLWVFAHTNSGLHHHPEILRRLLRRVYAYIDAINVHGPALQPGQLASFYDDFACAPASTVFREFQSLYPGLIPPNSAAEWDRAMIVAADNLWAAHGKRQPSWVNTDVAIAVEFLNFGLKTNRREMLDKARSLIDAVLTSGQLFEDGAVGYIWTQNEAGGYQSTVARYVSHFHEITLHPPALEILRRMEWYGPINGPMIDWWTSPSWKHSWNFISGSGQTGEATNGRNPYVRASMDAAINAAATRTNWIGQQEHIAWYRCGVKALERPDYSVFDRNIQGPRMWNGLWNVTGTLRTILDKEPGHHTLMGCQIMETSPGLRVNAAMMGIFPRIRVAPQPSRNKDDTFNASRHAWLTSKLAGDSSVTPDFSSLAASYKIHVFRSSTKGAEHDWTARQVWLNLPDRMIGLLDLMPDSDQTAFEVQGAIRFGFGGTAYSELKSLISTAADSWNYGDLTVKLHGHNYAVVHEETYSFRRPKAPITELTLRDRKDGAVNTKPRAYQAGKRWKFIAEIRPRSTTRDVTVTEVTEAGGLIGFEVAYPDRDVKFRLLYNPGTAELVHHPAISRGTTARIHRSGTCFRPDWIPEPSGPPPVNILSNGQAITIKSKAHVVLKLMPDPDAG